jgi:hypothetical protein
MTYITDIKRGYATTFEQKATLEGCFDDNNPCIKGWTKLAAKCAF